MCLLLVGFSVIAYILWELGTHKVAPIFACGKYTMLMLTRLIGTNVVPFHPFSKDVPEDVRFRGLNDLMFPTFWGQN